MGTTQLHAYILLKTKRIYQEAIDLIERLTLTLRAQFLITPV